MSAQAISMHHALQYWRRRGLRRTLARIVARFVYGSQDFIITRISLVGPIALDRVGDVTLRLATADDLDRLDELERYDHRGSIIRGHANDGEWVFVACHGERIVAARVMMRAVPAHQLSAKALTLGPGQVWDEDMFCVPDFRGRGIARHLSIFSDRYIASLGYTETFASVSTWNIPSLKMQVHKGSQFAYHVSYRRFLVYRRLRVSREIPRGTPGSDVIASLPLWLGAQQPR